MAALICKGLCLPCKALGECFKGACQCLNDLFEPIGKFLCNPEHPFSTCFFLSFLTTSVPALLTLGILLSSWGGLAQSCAASGLHTTTIVHVAIFLGHFLFAYYLNKSFLEVERGHDVVKKFKQMFLYDPVVLLYIAFVIFNVVWLGYTQTAIGEAHAEGCCDAYPDACSLSQAVFALEIAFLVLMPGVVALSLFNECCVGDRKRVEEARKRQQEKYQARGGQISLGGRLMGLSGAGGSSQPNGGGAGVAQAQPAGAARV